MSSLIVYLFCKIKGSDLPVCKSLSYQETLSCKPYFLLSVLPFCNILKSTHPNFSSRTFKVFSFGLQIVCLDLSSYRNLKSCRSELRSSVTSLQKFYNFLLVKVGIKM